jgi:hypothetical protein
MAHGLSGRPKSEQHKRRISEGVKRAARKHESDLWATKFQLSSLLAQKEFPTPQALQDAFVKALMQAVKASSSAMDMAEAQRQAHLKREVELFDELHQLRGELRAADTLWETGQRVKNVDSRELVSLARQGLLDQRVVDKELERRDRALPNPMHARPTPMHAIGNGPISHGAVVSGFLICREPGCSRQVPAEKGVYCDEHRKAEPRIFLTMNHTPRNLDAEHGAAEQRLRRAQGETAVAEAKLKDIEAQIEAFDRAHPRD